MNRIPLIKPYITDEVKTRVIEVLESGFLTEGSVTTEFERKCSEYIGCKYAIAVTSCTTGLEMALRCLKIGPGDEVIVPDYTYPATADVVNLVGAKTVIADINPETMLIDYESLDKVVSKKTKAIIPVSLFGNPLDYDILNAFKAKYNLYVIEDAACALGSEYNGKKTGNLADISVFSFHPRKFITTGEGGLITTNHDQWAIWLNSYKHFGMRQEASREGIIFEQIGTNYKLSNVLSAIGLVQMKHIHELLEKRIALSRRYIDLLKNIPGIKIPLTTPSGKHSYQSFCIYINERNRIMNDLREEGIEVQIGTYSLHMHPAFKSSDKCLIKSDMTGSRYSFEHCLTLPLFHDMSEKIQSLVVNALLKSILTGPSCE